jgi:membrane protein DedA with SNARE-associated domain
LAGGRDPDLKSNFMTNILGALTNLIIHIISTLGYAGVGLLMALQTMAIPIPSEVILPFAGFLASAGRFNIFVIALMGGLGSCIGSSIAYYIGYKGGRPLVLKYGKYILISHHDLDMTEKFFAKFGSIAIFIGQLLPIVRSFIAFAAGLVEEVFWKFILFTFLGSFLWSLMLAYIGMKLGDNWATLRDKFHNLDLLIVLIIIVGIVWWVNRHIRNRNKETKSRN